jgi:hypothetical protein
VSRGPLARLALSCTRSDRCSAEVRGSGGLKCQLPHHHSGHHSTVVFGCDGCSGIFRGRPHASAADGEYPNALHFCYPCAEGLR